MRQLKITILILFVSSFYKLSAQTCKQEHHITLGQAGNILVDPLTVLDDPVDGVEYTIAPNILDCQHVTDTLAYTVSGSDGFSCSGHYIVQASGPVTKLFDNLVVPLGASGTVMLTRELVDNGSFAVCSEIKSFEFSRSFFTSADLGEHTVFIVVRDRFGKMSTGQINIDIQDKIPPYVRVTDTVSFTLAVNESWSFPTAILTEEAILEPDVLNVILDNTGIASKSFSQHIFGCTDIGYNDVVFKVTDLGGNTTEVPIVVQILPINIDYDASPECNPVNTLLTGPNSTAQVHIEDLMKSGSYDCASQYTLTIRTENGEVVPADQLTGDNTYNYNITYNANQESCSGIIYVRIVDNCPITEDDIKWPAAVLTVYQEEVDITKISPEDLISLGYSKEQVEPIVAKECALIESFFIDESFQTGEGGYKVLRIFTVIDSYSAQVFKYTQVIKVHKILSSISICDTLDRTTPVGDCASGHTLDDDVEWPADIRIADHRITPEGLVQVSGVDYRDARPQFFGDVADSYSASYVDLVGSLNDSTLTILRKWQVKTSKVSSLSWDFEQEITVDFSSFSDMVTVSDHDGYTLSGVTFADTYTTDEDGIAYVPSTVGLTPYKSDKNAEGLDVLDLILTRHRILNYIQLDHNSSIRANSVVATNQDPPAGINTRDVLQTTRMIHGKALNTYRFIDSTSTSQSLIKPRAHFVGYKLGDVDNSYRTGITFEGEVGLAYDDILLNAGEAYDIPIYANHDMNGYGCQMRMAIDTHMLQIVGVETDNKLHIHHSFDSKGHLFVTNITNPGDPDIAEKEHFFTIKAVAKQNSLLNLVMKVVEDDKTFFVGDDYKRYHIKENVNDGIINKVKDIGNVSFIKTYPNPVSHSLYIDVTDSSIDNYTIHLFDASGSLRFTGANVASIAMDRYTAGAYILVLTTDSDVYRQRLIKY